MTRFTEAMIELTLLSAMEDYDATVHSCGGDLPLTALDRMRIENAVLFGIKHTLLAMGYREGAPTP